MNNIEEVSARIGDMLKAVMFGEIISALRMAQEALREASQRDGNRYEVTMSVIAGILTKVDSNELLK